MGLSQQTVGQAMWLASGYSLGLGIPFLFLALGLERATGWVRRIGKYRRAIQITSGVFIIMIGILLFTNTMSLIAIWAVELGSLIEVVNRFGSFFYGSILGVFLLAIGWPRANSLGALVGLIAGMSVVGYITLSTTIAFLWHNLIGAVVVVGVGMIVSELTGPRKT